MNKHLLSLSTWILSAPQRVKNLIVIALLVVLVAALVIPTAFAAAGPMDGGPDVTPLSVLLAGF